MFAPQQQDSSLVKFKAGKMEAKKKPDSDAFIITPSEEKGELLLTKVNYFYVGMRNTHLHVDTGLLDALAMEKSHYGCCGPCR
jgi:hypothetical protein